MDKKDRNSLVDSSPSKGRATDPSLKGAEADEISLKELILKLQEWYRYLLTRWIIIISTGILGGGVGLAYAYSQKPVYTAELTFVLEGKNSGGSLANYAGLASQFGINMGSGGGGVFEGQNFFELMKSRLMIEKVLLTTVHSKGKKQTLAEYYIDIKGLREKWSENPKLKNIQFLPGSDPNGFTLEQNAMISSFHNSLVAKNLVVDNKDKKSSIISMRFSSEDELFSKYFTEVLVKEVSDLYIDTKTRKSVKNLAILQFQVDSVRRQFNNAISGGASSIDANPNPNIARTSLKVPYQRKQVDAQANQAMLMELMKNLAISQISLREETPLIQTIDKPILPLPKEEISKFKGLIIGALLTIFITISILVATKLLRGVMN
jgi:uncharacterized protein involved in exopolysaccharide biosynthesis